MLRCLYVDLNSYFASVEQQLAPDLRGRPVGVLPVMADTTCCIAASVEAKRSGIRTGTPVWQARKLCPGIVFVQARPAVYVEMHHRILAAVESCNPVEAVLSIDEMCCRLMGSEREESRAVALAGRIKEAIYAQAGEGMRCSVGIAPNRFLAKTASNMQKPDGLTVIRQADLPERLYALRLGDLTGIGRAMEVRLARLGIATVEALYGASVATLRTAWGGIEGERFYARLRGEDVAPAPTRRSTVGHSHVLPPEARDPVSALAVVTRLLHKAATRLRHYGLSAGGLALHLAWRDAAHTRWREQRRFAPHADTPKFNVVLAELWKQRPPLAASILKVGVVLYDLVETRQLTRDLFADDGAAHAELSRVVDTVNARFGPNALYYGGAHHGRGAAPMRIAFTHIPEPGVERDA